MALDDSGSAALETAVELVWQACPNRAGSKQRAVRAFSYAALEETSFSCLQRVELPPPLTPGCSEGSALPIKRIASNTGRTRPAAILFDVSEPITPL